MVFRKQYNEEGKYIEKDYTIIDEDGKEVIVQGVNRYDILSCERTESIELYDTGEIDENGDSIIEQRVVVNKGWDNFGTLKNAIEQYGLKEYTQSDEVI